MRCDYIAEGVINAAKELQMNVPLIVRLKGTKEAEAKECVSSSAPLLYLFSMLYLHSIPPCLFRSTLTRTE